MGLKREGRKRAGADVQLLIPLRRPYKLHGDGAAVLRASGRWRSSRHKRSTTPLFRLAPQVVELHGFTFFRLVEVYVDFSFVYARVLQVDTLAIR